ncbi:MAG TPA: hypothetical protein VFP76_03985 [Gemmatimonadota bacterium]|nr:hypothetical protein [Gemmatimonadota bacterium]
MTLRNTARLTALALGLTPVLAAAQEPGTAPPCAREEYRQFDFWLGTWEVTTPDGKVAGTNTIESVLNGCALRESWRGAGGMTGTSTNTYDPHAGRWHQTWVDDRGGFLLISGGLEKGSMVLEGEMVDEEGPVVHRIAWTPGPAGEVRQLWEASRDGGTTWVVVFDGLYRRAGEAAEDD